MRLNTSVLRLQRNHGFNHLWCVKRPEAYSKTRNSRRLDPKLQKHKTRTESWASHPPKPSQSATCICRLSPFTPGHVMRLLWSDIYLMWWNTYTYTWSRHAFTLIRYLSDVLKHLHLHLVTSCVYSDPISIWCVETLTFTPGHVMRLLWSDIYLMCWNTFTPGHVMRLLWSDIYLMCWNTSIYTWSRHAFTLIRYLSFVLKHLHLTT